VASAGLKPIPGGDIVNGRKSAQIEVLRAPPEPQSGGIFAFLTDPDGNRISLRQAGS
jgi:predicted enzyme related to lactoylglutathione lyase